MLIVILKDPQPPGAPRQGANVELRVLIENMTVEEAEVYGDAINEFARNMGRFAKLDAFSLDPELMVS
jgi:hypothetical protein